MPQMTAQQQAIQNIAILDALANAQAGQQIKAAEGNIITVTAAMKQQAQAKIGQIQKIARAKVGAKIDDPASGSKITVTDEIKRNAEQVVQIIQKIQEWKVQRGQQQPVQPRQTAAYVPSGEPFVSDFLYRM